MKCSNCGISGEKAKLFDVISGEGIVKLCEHCLSRDAVPLKRSDNLPIGAEKKQTTYERLSHLAGINPEEHKMNVLESRKKEELKKQEVTLRDLVDKKFDKFIKEEIKKREDLVDNFHWIIMRARRHKKMSVSQLAKEIGEPEKVIKMAEQGVLPEGYDVAIKLEQVLGIQIIKPEIAETLKRYPKTLSFDKIKSKTITIADLQKMNEDAEIEIPNLNTQKKIPYWKSFINKLIEKRKQKPEAEESKSEDKSEGKNFEKKQSIEKTIETKKEKEEIAEFDDVIEQVEYDDTSLQMTISKPDSKKETKKEKELTQEEIDSIIFGKDKKN